MRIVRTSFCKKGAGAVTTLCLLCAVWAATFESAAGSGVAGAAAPNDYLCYLAGSNQSAGVGAAYAIPLEVELSSTSCSFPTPDTASGTIVSFAVVTSVGGPSVDFAAGASVGTVGGIASASVTANAVDGAFSVVATSAATSSNPTSQSVTFSLTNFAGVPASVTAGLGATQATTIDTAFSLRLAVTVDDALGNPVTDVPVTFTAPSSGASGTFSNASNSVTVYTDASGIAVAPVFTANAIPGGYVVKAFVGGYSPSAAFALVNDATPSGTVSAVVPSTIRRDTANQSVTISGSGFASGAVASFSDEGIAVSSTTFVNSTSIVVIISVANTASIGVGNVSVTNPSGTTATGIDIFSVTGDGVKPPVLSLGFAGSVSALDASLRHALGVYASKLPSGSTVSITGYAKDDITLARTRASKVVTFMRSVDKDLHATVTVVTSRAIGAVRVQTISL
jgi:hypothetical protein